jgi:cell division septation protein DedD
MAIEFQCVCGRRLRTAEEHAGKKGRCPACHESITIPEITGSLARSIASHGFGVGEKRKGPEKAVPPVETPEKDRGWKPGDRFTEEESEGEDERGPETERTWFRSTTFLILTVVLVVLLGVAVVFTFMKQKGKPVKDTLVLQDVAPLFQESEETTSVPVEPELSEETRQIEEASVVESPGTEPEPAEEGVVETVGPEVQETGDALRTVEEEEQGMSTLEERPESVEAPASLVGSYTINLASFRQKERADQLVQQLREQDIDAFRWEIDLPEKGRWHRVSTGNFPTRKEAEDYAKQTNLADRFTVFITKIEGV